MYRESPRNGGILKEGHLIKFYLDISLVKMTYMSRKSLTLLSHTIAQMLTEHRITEVSFLEDRNLVHFYWKSFSVRRRLTTF